jgi:apolipoprotein N-acyltransferase
LLTAGSTVRGCFLSGASWIYVSINVYGSAPVPLALFLTLCFCLGLALLHGTQALVYRHFGAQTPFWAPVTFAALWGLFEWLRSWLLTGFPWLYAGYTAHRQPAQGMGTAGRGLRYRLFDYRARGKHRLTDQDPRGSGRTLGHCRVSVTVGNGPSFREQGMDYTCWGHGFRRRLPAQHPLERKWDRRYFFPILDQYAEKTAELYGNHDIVLWPESALPAYQDRLGDYLTEQSLLATAGKATLITGVPIREQANRYNSIVALGQGEGSTTSKSWCPLVNMCLLSLFFAGSSSFSTSRCQTSSLAPQ